MKIGLIDVDSHNQSEQPSDLEPVRQVRGLQPESEVPHMTTRKKTAIQKLVKLINTNFNNTNYIASTSTPASESKRVIALDKRSTVSR